MSKPRTKKVPLNAENLTNDIIARIQYDGWDAWRINTVGIWDPNKGIMRKIKESEKGKSDVWCVCNGRTICLEVKVDRDTQSDEQKSFERRVVKAGGVYVIIKTQQDFLKFWTKYKRDNNLVSAPPVIKNQLSLV